MKRSQHQHQEHHALFILHYLSQHHQEERHPLFIMHYLSQRRQSVKIPDDAACVLCVLHVCLVAFVVAVCFVAHTVTFCLWPSGCLCYCCAVASVLVFCDAL